MSISPTSISKDIYETLPKTLKECIAFHGHLCPGLVYGYIVSNEALRLFGSHRSRDEEIITVCETDACSVDAFQVILGTTAGKGNLIIDNIGKSVFRIYSRNQKKALRFSRTKGYTYTGKHQDQFNHLEKKFTEGNISPEERVEQKHLKSADLIQKPFLRLWSE